MTRRPGIVGLGVPVRLFAYSRTIFTMGLLSGGGWLPLEGQALPINANEAMFAELGTTFGGNGQNNFAVPDLRNRANVGSSAAWPVGEVRGSNLLTLTAAQMPAHTHTFVACSLSDVAGAGPSLRADGELTADDIIVFIRWFVGGDTRADIARSGQQPTPDGEFTADDIIFFVSRFAAGC